MIKEEREDGKRREHAGEQSGMLIAEDLYNY